MKFHKKNSKEKLVKCAFENPTETPAVDVDLTGPAESMAAELAVDSPEAAGESVRLMADRTTVDPEGAVEGEAEDWEVKVQAPAIVDGPAAAAVGDFLLAAAFVCQPQEQSLSPSLLLV